VQAPAIVSLREVEKRVDPNQYNQGRQVVGVLLEGKFQSVFKNRYVKDMEKNTGIPYNETSKNTQQIVISDGNLIKNEVSQRPTGTYISPLGYDKYTRQTYGNKDFAINCVHYLADKEGLINIRGKEIKLRLLDKKQVQTERMKWQLLNSVLPVIVIILFGLVKNILRRRKYVHYK
jgi:ABC-2 type transport system permease protein